MKRLAQFVFLLVCSFILLGCLAEATPGPVAVKGCTLIGCGSTLNVRFKGQVPHDYTMEAVGDGKTLTAHCVNGALAQGTYYEESPVCESAEVWFTNFQPQELKVTIHWGGHSVSQTFHPVYQISYPNGPDCKPACPNAIVEFTIPENP